MEIRNHNHSYGKQIIYDDDDYNDSLKQVKMQVLTLSSLSPLRNIVV